MRLLYADRPSGSVDRARDSAVQPPRPNTACSVRCGGALPDLKWRHQVPVGPYFADILYFSERLVIEVDGDTHAETGAFDAARDAFLRREGYRIHRFANADVIQNLEGVLTHISFSLRGKEGAYRVNGGRGDQIQKRDARV